MNPLGGLVALLGVVLILIGIAGTQHNVAQALRGARPTGPGGASLAPGTLAPGPFNKAGGAVGGFGLVPQGPGRPPQLAPPQTGGGLSA